MSVESTHLGKQSAYPQKYAPNVLVAVPRNLNRVQYQLDDSDLPFTGFDTWHAYEFSFLTKNGLPVVGILKIVYPCNNPSIVESKSLKLYLNSFNMEYIGDSLEDGIRLVANTIKTDLQSLLECKVDVDFHHAEKRSGEFDFNEYQLIEEVAASNLEFDIYNESPDLLDETSNATPIYWGSHLLRSNCKITNQPDWGSVYIYLNGNTRPSPEALLKYIVSLRNENHFHEEICEMIFKRLFDKYSPDDLMVACLYTRRGGIDINPVRSTKRKLFPKRLGNVNAKTSLAFRQ